MDSLEPKKHFYVRFRRRACFYYLLGRKSRKIVKKLLKKAFFAHLPTSLAAYTSLSPSDLPLRHTTFRYDDAHNMRCFTDE